MQLGVLFISHASSEVPKVTYRKNAKQPLRQLNQENEMEKMGVIHRPSSAKNIFVTGKNGKKYHFRGFTKAEGVFL